MTLKKEFQEKVKSLIDESLEPHGIQTLECEKKYWNYRSDDDFKYGHKAGVIIGIVIGYYIAKYDKIPGDKDMLEINKMVEIRKEEIKQSFSDIHSLHKE